MKWLFLIYDGSVEVVFVYYFLRYVVRIFYFWVFLNRGRSRGYLVYLYRVFFDKLKSIVLDGYIYIYVYNFIRYIYFYIYMFILVYIYIVLILYVMCIVMFIYNIYKFKYF